MYPRAFRDPKARPLARFGLAAAILCCSLPVGLAAQEAEPAGTDASSDLSQWQISGNPFLLLAEWFAGEVEYAPGESVGFGLTFSHYSDPDNSDESDGFYLGLGGGLTRLFDAEDLELIPIVRLVNVGWSF
jgi:hypothetical protein